MSAKPLQSVESDFAVNSSGFSTGQFMRWFDVKYGEREDRMWLKLHLMCGVKTNIVTSVHVTDGHAHDYHYLKPLMDHTVETGFKVKELSADKGYLGADNPLQLWTRHFYALNRAEFLQHYHKRSNIETTFHMIKSSVNACGVGHSQHR